MPSKTIDKKKARKRSDKGGHRSKALWVKYSIKLKYLSTGTRMFHVAIYFVDRSSESFYLVHTPRIKRKLNSKSRSGDEMQYFPHGNLIFDCLNDYENENLSG